MSVNDVDLLEGADEDVIVSNTLERDWKGIVTALLVIVIMCSIIVAAVLLFTPLTNGVNTGKSVLTIADILSTNLVSELETLEWLDADHLLVKIQQNYTIIDTSKSDYPNSTFEGEEILMNYGRVLTWSFSHDRQYIAMGFDERKRGRYRHSQYANYKIARLPKNGSDEGTKIIDNVGPNNTQDQLLELFKWNPQSNAYVFVHEHDIYYLEDPESNITHRITRDQDRLIYNGVADWIYEEEIFSSNAALWWSRSGKYLAYASVDDRNVTEIEYSIYENQRYPTTNRIPYPKTGAENLPKISLWIFDRVKKETRKMTVKLSNESYATYLFSVCWIQIRDKDVLIAVFANRYQHHVSITACTFESSECVLNYDQPFKIRERQLWAEPDDFRIRFFADDAYFVKLPRLASNGEIYNHIARITVPPQLANGRATFLPVGNYEVSSISGYDAAKQKIYFMAATPKPSQRHLFVTSSATKSNSNLEEARCLSCGKFDNCTYQEVTFSKDMDKFVISCRGPGIQRFYLSSLASNISILKEFGDFDALVERYNSILLPKRLYEEVTLKNGYVALVEMILPSELDTDAVDQKFPVVISVYGGPGSQKVLDDYSPCNIDTLLGTRYVVVFIDARGSGMRGWSYKEPLLGNFGTVEVDDQIETIRLLAEKHRFIDSQKIAIWGWSYGGFVAAQAVERDENKTFKCAVSVAPVTNFKLYDATYTERYMGNASIADYKRTDLTRNVTRFRNIQYLLVHGTADDISRRYTWACMGSVSSLYITNGILPKVLPIKAGRQLTITKQNNTQGNLNQTKFQPKK